VCGAKKVGHSGFSLNLSLSLHIHRAINKDYQHAWGAVPPIETYRYRGAATRRSILRACKSVS